MWTWHDGVGGWDWLWMWLMMAAFWIPLLIAVFWLSGGLGARGSESERREPSAPELVRRAYARGEIDRSRFLEMMQDLEGTGPAERREGRHGT